MTDAPTQKKKKSSVPCCLLLLLCTIAVLVWAYHDLHAAQRHSFESGAIGNLKALVTSQVMFKEGDRDGDGARDFAESLAELSNATLIDSVLGSNANTNYEFQLARDAKAPETRWTAVAAPLRPGVSGDRYFVVDQDGAIFYSLTAPFSLDPDAKRPVDAQPLGR
jgi:hypothetical protein